ncbi:unnamed protein product [Alternaria alternata]
MKSLRSKASHFFRDSPSRDEKTAITDSSDVDFDAGIQDAGMKNKRGIAVLPAQKRQAGYATAHSVFQIFIIDTVCSGSRLFGGSKDSGSTQSTPPPPVPQIPKGVSLSKSRRPILTPSAAARGSRISLTKAQGRSIYISRPRLMAQLCSPPILENPITVPFKKRPGPPPVRPPRPDSLDEETLAFMRESGTRIFLLSSNRGSASTATTSTARSQSSSIEARLGFPSGCGTTPRSCSIESPLAARFMLDPNQRLTVRDSSDGVGYSRFSEYVRYQHDSVRAADGVDAEDREIGPIERYDASKEGDWMLEKRVSQGRDGKGGGMLFRDRWGGFHFVADI